MMKILVVDNDPTFLKFVEQTLHREGHAVVTAKDGLAALDLVRQSPPDMAFIDFIMPNIDGGELCRIIRSRPECRSTFVVLLSGLAAEQWPRLTQFGADACMAKVPFEQLRGLLLQIVQDPQAAAMACAMGKVIGLSEVSPRGITQELLESKEHFQTLLNRMTEGILELNAKQRVVYVNPAALALLGRGEPEVLGNAIDEMLPQDQVDIFTACRNDAHRQGVPSAPPAMVMIRDRFVEIKCVALGQGRGHRIVILNDISGFKQSEAALKATNRFLNNILDSSCAISIMATDLDQNIDFWNKGAENMFGYRAEEVVGREKVTLLYPGPGENNKARQIQDKVRTTREPAAFVVQEMAKDGRLLWIKVHLSPRLDDAGNVTGLLGIGEDITAAKLAEEEKAQLHLQLLQAQKMEAIGTLAGGVAHDFNNLLMGIQGHASLALKALETNRDVANHIRTIERLVKSGERLTQQLLGIVRGGKYEERPTDLNTLIRYTAEMFGRTRKELTIETVLADDLWGAAVDRILIEQALLNLFLNAWQAMPGTGKLTIETANRVLKAEEANPCHRQAGRYVQIRVKDSGAGMDADTREKVFDPFFTTKKKGPLKGTGLGLSSVYGIIQNHRGSITVDSEVDRGSVFTILLPATTEPLPVKSRRIEELKSGKETIMVVDDEAPVLDVAVQMLECLGYQVIAAAEGKIALDVFGRDHKNIDMVILDMIMPEMQGREVFHRIQHIHPGCKVLLSSGYSIDGEAEEILNLGALGFIQKPFSLAYLSRKVRAILDS